MPALSPTDHEPLAQVTLAGSPIYYRRHGDGPPLLLIHGWGGSSRYWRGTLAALGHSHDVIAPDLPGFGESPPLAGHMDSHRIADLVLAFADQLGLEQFDLNGHSFSAGVATYVAARHPERVRRLVLTSYSTFRNEFERRVVDQIHRVLSLWMSLRRPWMADQRLFYRAVSSRFFYRLPKDDAVLRESFADFLKMDKRTALESASSAGDPAINPALTQVRAPTLIIGARQDSIMPPAGTPHAAKLVPDSRLVWIERCGHLPMIERPDIYHQLLAEFLD
ncbi:alpha/beta hydrolase [Oscillochloris sp. ZM17-4]|uniref:alpha/beta fold hydrolase n=1 Tax=Oscillochloris sp. ZM17-4 TaxID=2866714 RepID=UPI001C72CBD9|nr:alpha/beta hydrolase [Oscillochloris sp. ZM17-4]MBX0328979.1 alpha/beta hydrolase [Oscillochloris sp. ZM17-4]